MKAIKHYVITIDPQRAAEILGRRYSGQRSVSPYHVAKMVEDILCGRFILGPDPIVQLQDGTLANGQHRLLACVEANMPIDVVYTTGWSEESYFVMDANRRRALADRVQEDWLKASWKLAAVRATVAGMSESRRARLSEGQIVATALKYDTEFQFLFGMEGAWKLRSHVMAVCARALISGVDADAVSRFVAIVATGTNNGLRDSAAVKLFSWVNSTAGRAASRNGETYKKTSAALRAFLEGRAIGNLQAVESELWRMPWEATS